MKPTRHIQICLLAAGLALAALPPAARAFPPAPHHLIYGLVRDQYGTPLMSTDTIVMLQTPTGTQLTTTIAPGFIPGVNYQLDVPMDAGITPDVYSRLALITAAPFKMYVITGTTTNVPIQMTGNYSQLGQPGKQTRVDLTLGVDANGDGLPDAWEYAFLAALGGNYTLSDITTNADLAHDGRNPFQEFVTGSLLFDPGNPFSVTLVGVTADSPLLQFDVITGRSYTVLGSADLQNWTPMSFTIPAEGQGGATRSFYFAGDIRTLQVQAIQPGSGPTVRFFKVLLQ